MRERVSKKRYASPSRKSSPPSLYRCSGRRANAYLTSGVAGGSLELVASLLRGRRSAALPGNEPTSLARGCSKTPAPAISQNRALGGLDAGAGRALAGFLRRALHAVVVEGVEYNTVISLAEAKRTCVPYGGMESDARRPLPWGAPSSRTSRTIMVPSSVEHACKHAMGWASSSRG